MEKSEIISPSSDGSHGYFENRGCRYYPCHNSEHINCLFCFCPLYCLEDCGGNFSVKDGIKDCSKCVFPHERQNYSLVIGRLAEINRRKKGCPGIGEGGTDKAEKELFRDISTLNIE